MTHSHDTATPALSVESKYVLVPREATKSMALAGESGASFGFGRPYDDESIHKVWRAMIAAAPAPNPSPAAKGGEAVLEWETCKPLFGNHAERAPTSFGDFRIERHTKSEQFRLTGPGLAMNWNEGLESGKAAIEQYFVGILQDYAAALATPSPQPAEAVREALIDARNNGLIYWEPNTERGHTSKALMLARIDAALASDPAPAGISTEGFLRGMARMSSYPVEICQKFEDLADLVTEHENAAS